MKYVVVLLCAVALSGCAAFTSVVPILNDVSAVVEDGARILEVIRCAETSYFVMNPNPAVQAKIEKAIGAASLALDAVVRAANGAKSIEDKDYAGALDSFKLAYAEVETALKQVGIVSASGKMGGPRGVEMDFPKPLAMSK